MAGRFHLGPVRQDFFYVTAGTNNDGRSAPLVVFITEWMANNTSYLADPADNDNDDGVRLSPGARSIGAGGRLGEARLQPGRRRRQNAIKPPGTSGTPP